MIQAQIIADSINEMGDRIVTYLLTYPRFIHSEVMTHRAFSRNAASSRAIPVDTMLKAITENPAMPEFWGKTQKGMQANIELDEKAKEKAIKVWLTGMKKAISTSKQLLKLKVHKQIANRVTEPWAHMTTILTGTDFENFFALRAHIDAQPEFQLLAYKMLHLYNLSEPKLLKAGKWHMPYGDEIDEDKLKKECEMQFGWNTSFHEKYLTQMKIKIAVARCARTSYTTPDTQLKHDYESDVKLHDRLLQSGHMSPFEHCAQSPTKEEYFEIHELMGDLNAEGLNVRDRLTAVWGNFKGWKQYRKTIAGENKTDDRLKKVQWIKQQ